MDVRDFLENYKKVSEKLDELKEKAYSVGGFDYGRERVQSNPSQKAPYEDYIIQAVDKYEAEFKNADSIINQLQPQEQKVIRMRYRYGLQWATIHKSMKKSDRAVFLIHAKSLKKLQSILDGKD